MSRWQTGSFGQKNRRNWESLHYWALISRTFRRSFVDLMWAPGHQNGPSSQIQPAGTHLPTLTLVIHLRPQINAAMGCGMLSSVACCAHIANMPLNVVFCATPQNMPTFHRFHGPHNDVIGWGLGGVQCETLVAMTTLRHRWSLRACYTAYSGILQNTLRSSLLNRSSSTKE